MVTLAGMHVNYPHFLFLLRVPSQSSAPSSFQMDHTWTDRETMYISYIGKLFLRMLKALILPLIIPSLVAAVGSLDMSLSGKVSLNSLQGDP